MSPAERRIRQSEIGPGLFLVDPLNALIGLTLRRRSLPQQQLEIAIMAAWPDRLVRPQNRHIRKRLTDLSDRYGVVADIEQAGIRMYGLTEEGQNLFDLAAQTVQRGMGRAAAKSITDEVYRQQHPIISQFPDVVPFKASSP